MPRIAVEHWNVQHMEYMDPNESVLNVLLTSGEWRTVERNKNKSVFEALVAVTLSADAEIAIKPFGWREREEEARMRQIAQEEALKAVLAAREQSVPSVPATKTEEPVGPTVENNVVTLHKDDATKPTVNVVLPPDITPVMELQVTNAVAHPNPASIDAQVEVALVPVEAASTEATIVAAVTEPAAAANIAVVVEPAAAEALKAVDVDPAATVEQALAVAAPVLPAKAEEVKEIPVKEPVPAPEPAPVAEATPGPVATDPPAQG